MKIPIRAAVGGVGAVIALGWFTYTQCRIEVPSRHMAVLIRKTGDDLDNSRELSPAEDTKGVQPLVLAEGRYFYNPYNWDWVVSPQIEIPGGKLGVRTRLFGDNLPPGDLIAWTDNQKGIVPDVLRPGRYALNAWLKGSEVRGSGDSYAEHVTLFDPVTVPAGFKGVVTLLSAPMPDDPNQLLTQTGRRGVQRETLDPGTYYVNPYVTRIDLVDCRSQRFNLANDGDMGFPSKDGFWVNLEGVIEFRVKPSESASVFVTYNDSRNGERLDEEVISKIILPNARSFCRLRGSNHSGREFISGDTRVAFQNDFQQALAETCSAQGIEIIQALITKIRPPDKIATPVRARQIAFQEERQYLRQIEQFRSEQLLAIEQQLVSRKQAMVTADQGVVKAVTQAEREQEVALIGAQQRLAVAQLELEASKDRASAILARGSAEADVIRFQNEAQAAGWETAVAAFGGNGEGYARWTMLRKMAPAYRSMMVNTADSPLMDIFSELGETTTPTEGDER